MAEENHTVEVVKFLSQLFEIKKLREEPSGFVPLFQSFSHVNGNRSSLIQTPLQVSCYHIHLYNLPELESFIIT